MSVSTLGPGRKEFMNHGDFHAEGDSILLLNGVPPNLKTPSAKQPQSETIMVNLQRSARNQQGTLSTKLSVTRNQAQQHSGCW